MDTKTRLETLLPQVANPIYLTRHRNEFTCSTQPDPNAAFTAFAPAMGMQDLGDPHFKKRHGLTYAYVAGAMANGIASADMVKAMGKNGMMGFFGAGGLDIPTIEKNILDIKSDLGTHPFGFNLIHSLGDPEHEMATVELYLKHGINKISAAAFMRMTPALVYYRIKGIHRGAQGEIITPNAVIAKVSRIEIARQFFAPPPEKIVTQLLEKGLITPEEATLSQHIPMAQDLTAEADSGGHTDNRPALALLPTLLNLRDEFMGQYHYPEPLCVGLAGGIATPESCAAAFSMGAAYVLTGSINQSCVEAGIADSVKALLATAEQPDVAMAPAADMFEIGARVQVLKRGTLFPVRAEKLYRLYQAHDAFEAIPEKYQREIQDKYLLTDFNSAWESTRAFFLSRGNHREVEKALADPKHKMALVFRSYLGQSSRWAILGTPNRKMDYQIWCGPAIGAFNQWVKGSFLAPPENRRVATLALNLLFGACVCTRISFLRSQGIPIPPKACAISPMEMETIDKLSRKAA
ncbi:MAG: PfaD family polyunsaturated fatty acid/polyketide biosynthesis protein [Desulfovibrionales bacterium]|nr:PfaD family polyunsaturated fatty acid/polyketide biosynthesis protein [Desulfovibrionales bacterium]